MVRIPLVINGQRLKTLEELRENFNLGQLLERFHGGQLWAWLHNWEFETKLEQLEALPKDLSDAELAEALCRIFGVEGEAKEQAFRALNEEKIRQEEERIRQKEEQRRRVEEQQRQVVQKEWQFIVFESLSMNKMAGPEIVTLPSGSSVEWHRIGTDLILRSLSDSPPTEKEIRDFVNKSWVILPDGLSEEENRDFVNKF